MNFLPFQDSKRDVAEQWSQGTCPGSTTHAVSLHVHCTSRMAGLMSQPRQEEHRAAPRLQKNADGGWRCRNSIITWLLTVPPSEEVFHSTDSEKGGGGGGGLIQKRSLAFQLSGMSLCFPPSPTSCWFGELTRTPPPACGDPRKHRRKAGGWVALTSRTPALSSPGLPCSGLGHLPPDWGARGHGARPSQSGARATLLGPAVLLRSTAATRLAVSVPSGVTRQQAEVTLSSSTSPPPLKLHRLAGLLALGQDNRLLRKPASLQP